MIRRITVALILSLFLVSCVRPVANREDFSARNTAQPQVSDRDYNPAANTPSPSISQPYGATLTPTTTIGSPTITVALSQPTAQPVPTLTPLPESSPQYIVQPGTPIGIPNSALPGLGCNYSGLGGQAFDPDGEPLIGLLVEVGGTLDGMDIQLTALTGANPALGPGGFSIKLKDQSFASQSTLYVKLLDLDGEALSDQVPFDTYADCGKNLTLVNFTAASNVPPVLKIHLPYISGP